MYVKVENRNLVEKIVQEEETIHLRLLKLCYKIDDMMYKMGKLIL